MKRFSAMVFAGLALVAVTTAQAQKGSLFLIGSGGATIPMGDYKEYAKTGWMVNGGLGYNISNNLFVGGVGMYGMNSHKIEGEKTNLLGAASTIGYSFGGPTSKMAPYVRGTLGYLNHQFKQDSPEISEDEWEPVFGGAAGLFLPKGKMGWFLEGSYLTRDGTDFVGVNIGFTWSLMGPK